MIENPSQIDEHIKLIRTDMIETSSHSVIVCDVRGPVDTIRICKDNWTTN